MITSKKWLSQYMDLSDITVEELADKMTTAGLEVEGLKPLAQGTNLVIGYVRECAEHPNSDHLHVCQVDLGTTCEQIVCGAPNVKANQKVIVAKVGAKLPGGEIKNSVIRGIESNGMICSLLELGVDAKQLTDYQKSGIEELDDDAPLGGDPLAYLGLDDTLLDVGLTPNRSDCLASFALAKEVGAILHKKVTLPKFENASDIGEKTQLRVSSSTEKCPLFLGKVIREVTIQPSPKWITQILHAAGVKSINNVVDISNLVMLETGQPTHFYDIAKMHQDIVVSTGFDTVYTALDGVDYKIEPEDIMITTQGQPVGIAGLMGGDDSKIDETTKGIIIEVATFDYVQCRNTARRLNITSDASIRNSKEIEPGAVKKAMDRCVQLLCEYADAKGIEETAVYGNPHVENTEFEVSVRRINDRLGTQFSAEKMCEVLEWLDFSPKCDGDSIAVSVPSYRSDIKIEADISEEIIRLIGFDHLKATLPKMEMTQGELDPRQKMNRRIRNLLTHLGAYECESYTLVSQKHIEDAVMGLNPVVELASPKSEDRKYVRNTLLPSMLDVMTYNQNRSVKDLSLFEISNIYGVDQVEEHLGIVMAGAMQKSRWQKIELKANFYALKGMIETLLSNFGFEGSRVKVKENSLDTVHFHPYASGAVYIGKDLFGIFGVIHPAMAKKYDVSKDCVMLEANLEVLLKNKASKVKFEGISKYPSVSRDLAFVVKKEVQVGDIVETIKRCSKAIIKNVEVFDIYTGEHVAEDSKSIALSILFQSNDKTLTDQEINDVHNKILDALKKECNAELRG